MLLALWTAALAVGMAAGFVLTGRGLWVAAGLGLVAAVVACARRQPVWTGVFAALTLGIWSGARAVGPVGLDPPVARAAQSGDPVAMTALVVRALRLPEDKANARLLVDVDSIDGVRAHARMALSLPPGVAAPWPGTRLGFHSRLSEPTGLANFDRPAPGWVARVQGIELVGSALRDHPIVTLGAGGTASPRRWAHAAHLAMGTAIDRVTRPPVRGLLRALVLGERDAAGPEIEAGFQAAGAVHALSVSGLHLTAVAGLLFLLLRRGLGAVPAIALRMRTEAVAALLSIGAAAFYTLVTGEAVATLRSALMAALVFGAAITRRQATVVSAIAFAAAVLLLETPLLLTDVSFQLSFASVIALAVAGRARAGNRPVGHLQRARAWLWRSLVTTLSAFLVTAPLCAYHFASVAPAAPLGNILLVPPIELAIVPLGLLGSALGAVVPALGFVPLTLAGWLGWLVLVVVEGFRRAAPVIPIWSPNGWEAALGVAAGLLALAARPRGPHRRLFARGAVVAGLAVATSLGGRAIARRLSSDVRVTFLDIGQGDSALVEGPHGFVALIDGGGSVDGTFDPGAQVIAPLLHRRTIGRVDLVVLSHPHPDHLNGLFKVLEQFDIGAIWTNGEGAGNPEYDRFLAVARMRAIPVDEPGRIRAGDLTLEALGPWVDDRVRAPPGVSANDGSLVVRLTFGGRRILFPGDIEAQGEAELVARSGPRGDLPCDVLKVPHHGSRTSSSDDLLEAARPTLAVMSLGRRNRFGFPRPEILRRYAAHAIPVLRTDLHGAIEVRIAPGGRFQTTCARGCR